MSSADSSEALREALIELERARKEEASYRAESESLLAGLRLLSLGGAPERMFANLFEVLRGVLHFEEALLVQCRGGGALLPAATTSALMETVRWVPAGLTRRVLAGRPVATYDVAQVPEWAAQSQRVRARVTSALHLSLSVGDTVALLILTHSERGFFSRRHIKLATRFSVLATEALSKSVAAERLREADRKLVDVARAAGKAEMASNVLHNVGNALNSVGVAVSVARSKLEGRSWQGLEKVVDSLGEDDLIEFLGSDPRGPAFSKYIPALMRQLMENRRAVCDELATLADHSEHVRRVIASQQGQAGKSNVETEVSFQEIVEMALDMEATGWARHDLRLYSDLRLFGAVVMDKHKVLQILLNLLSNAKHATLARDDVERLVTIRLSRDAETTVIRLEVEDNGIGIAEESLARVFEHGFTTRDDGNGFGLHSSAILAHDLGGDLTVSSAGPMQGARFLLRVPAPLASDLAIAVPRVSALPL